MKLYRKVVVVLYCAGLGLLILASLKSPTSTLASLLYRDAKPNSILNAHPTTLLETWNIAEAYVQSNSLDAKISEIVSIDHPADASAIVTPGADGRRRAWMVMFVSDAWLLRITIWDGKVIDQSTHPLDTQLKPATSPRIESDAAIITARQRYPSLVPPSNHGRGFHFALGVDEQEQEILSVIGGRDENTLTNDIVVIFNSSTGEVMRALTRSFARAGGILFSDDGGITWQASDLFGKMTGAVAQSLSHPNLGYATVSNGTTITLYCSNNGGKAWSKVGKLPPEAGNWVTSMVITPDPENDVRTPTDQGPQEIFVITTRRGAWTSSDAQEWSRIAGLPEGPIQWAAVRYGQRGYQVFISIIDGPKRNRGLYVSSDLIDWEKFQEGSHYRLSESYDKTQVIAIEQHQAIAWKFTDEGREALALPAETRRCWRIRSIGAHGSPHAVNGR